MYNWAASSAFILWSCFHVLISYNFLNLNRNSEASIKDSIQDDPASVSNDTNKDIYYDF